MSSSEAPPRETILVVDDDVEVLAFVADVLDTEGYAVLRASDSREALRMAQNRSEPINLLLTDVVMPFMAGTDLAVHLRSLRPGIKVLLMSAFTSGTIEDHGIQIALVKRSSSSRSQSSTCRRKSGRSSPTGPPSRDPLDADRVTANDHVPRAR